MTRPEHSITIFSHRLKPTAERISPEKMSSYSNILRQILHKAGVEEPYHFQSKMTITPPKMLRDGTSVSVAQIPDFVLLDTGHGRLTSTLPEASILLRETRLTARADLITIQPIVTYDDQLFIHSGIAPREYRSANVEDSVVLEEIFTDLKTGFQV